MTRLRISVLVVLLLLTVGCGSSNRNSEFTSDPPTPTGTPFFIFASTTTPSFNQGVTTFRADRSSGAFQPVSFVSLAQGLDTGVRLALDPKDRLLSAAVSAVHSDSSVHMFLSVDASTGTLRLLNQTIMDHGESSVAIFDPTGQFFFLSTLISFNRVPQGWTGISVFRVNSDLTLTPVSGSPFGNDRRPLAMSPDGKFLFAWSDGDSSVHTFTLDASGGLNESSSSPLAGQFHQIAIHPSGKFAYDYSAVGGLTTRLQLLQIDSLTGQITPVADLLEGQTLSVPVLHPSGKFLYEHYCGLQIVSSCHNNPFQIAADGRLTEVPSSFSMSEEVQAFDPSGKFAYAMTLSTATRQLKLYTVDQTTGILTPTNVSSDPNFSVGGPVVTK
jgi:6-phosphogluconolactonase (cycloisomerase 2 family)